jgi:phage gp29-like protein
VTLSQTMTTDAKSAGLGSNQANVHDDVKDEVVRSDNNLICGSFNDGPAVWLTEWNYPGAAVPIVSRKLEDEPDLAALATRDKTLYDMGFEPTEEYVRATYGDGFVKRQVVTPPPGAFPPGAGGNPAAFALPLQSGAPLVAVWGDRIGDIASPAIAAMVDQIRALAADCGSLEELRDRVIELYPKLNPNLVARALQQALVASNLAGHYEAKQ